MEEDSKKTHTINVTSCSVCKGACCHHCLHAMSLNPIGLPKVHSYSNLLIDCDLPDRSSKDSLRPYASPIERTMHAGEKVSGPNVIVMVGLPARGKTYIAKKLTRYLNWIGIKAKTFNLGEYRRQAVHGYQNHDFFREDNQEAMRIREQVAKEALCDAFRWFDKEGGDVAIYDATNTTRQRRNFIRENCLPRGINIFFVESVCNDPEIVKKNVLDVKLNGPDYKDLAPTTEEALEDFVKRIRHYEDTYEPLDEQRDADLSFIRIHDAGKKYLVNRPGGHIQSRVVYFLMNIHITARTIYLTRHGESENNLTGVLGGDCDLSDRGMEYAERLGKFVEQENIPGLHVWTSQLKRTIQTAQFIDAPKEKWKCLNEIHAGICEELTYAEIQELYPVEFSNRDTDKFHYRYPGGESYEDVVARLEPVIIELERQNNVLVIGHQAILRCLIGYFLNKPPEDLPYQEIPLHTVVKLTPRAYGCDMVLIPLNVKAVDTHRPQPKNVGLHRTREEALETTPSPVIERRGEEAPIA
ncbi:6-phosphofructo-2-kinase/fructose-2,6-bisphosphatase [Hypsibius exemplaris]|uniref:6-phosphofructo-2-kinase/fructose-2, 6-bisphosphatase n=1 Tax=Hypsibius exemplaris TaxID=2072580 RepID=A0A1W0WMJ6_HYPEX|nr:6-phosphofructo-2-kinase/fructose-2,6-bisphosphatase [Hypsibius exemplaris]